MDIIDKLDLSSLLVSIAKSVAEANEVLNEDGKTAMAISEFTIEFHLHAAFASESFAAENKGVRVNRGQPLYVPGSVRPLVLRRVAHLTPRERLLSRYTGTSDLTVISKIEAIPVVES